jgi:hypothetical protein
MSVLLLDVISPITFEIIDEYRKTGLVADQGMRKTGINPRAQKAGP